MNKCAYILILTMALLLGGASSTYAQTSGPRIKGNVYGGGENAKVMGENLTPGENSTKITINNGTVYGDIYGAGKGVKIAETPATGTDGVGKEINPLKYDMVATVTGSTEVNIDTTLVGDKHGMVWGDIYGGAALAVVDGDTHVNIAGGKFAGEVFGGGKGDIDKDDATKITSANVLKNTYVNVTAGEIVWDRMLKNGEFISWTESTKSQFFNEANNKYLASHNIYAGGNIACTVGTWNNEGTSLKNGYEETGTSHLTMTRGLLGTDLLSSTEWQQSFSEHENPHFYAFGGGYGIYTKAHKSDVEVSLPMVSDASATGGDQQLARPRRAQGDPTPGDDPTLDMDIITDAYGVPWTTVLAVLGGGFNGHVEETNVLIGDATYAHRVYGGGLGSYEGWTQASSAGTPNTNEAGYVGTTGKLPLGDEDDPNDAPAPNLQTTTVTLAGGNIHGEVFGGGAGVAPGKELIDSEGKKSLSRDKDTDKYTDFTEIAKVKGNTLVQTMAYRAYRNVLFHDMIYNYANGQDYDPESLKMPNTEDQKKQRTRVYGNVYGGGDVANVWGDTTKVFYRGGEVFGKTFGAGLGRLASEALDYTSIGKVSGNSSVVMSDTVFIRKTNTRGESILDMLDAKDGFWNLYTEADASSIRQFLTNGFFTVQDATNIPGLGINFKPHAWDDIHGGGRNGVTGGDASVLIGGGYVGNNVFGGGLGDVRKVNGQESITSADVLGNTNVTVTGGQYLWREIADVEGNKKVFNDVAEEFDRNIIDNKMKLTPIIEPIKDFFDYNNAKYTRDHSIYGGGNIACKVGTYKDADGKYYDREDVIDMLKKPRADTGTSTVDMQNGLFADEDIHWTDDEKWNLATLCRYLACENSANYQFGVFGGGYGAHTKVGSTNVTLEMGTMGVKREKENPSYVSTWLKYMGSIQTWFSQLTDEEKHSLYGGTDGPNVQNRYLTSRMAHSINVPSHTVLTTAGGGLAGYVAGNTKVNLTQRSGALRIFGGGIGQRPDDSEFTGLNEDAAQTKADGLTYGQVGGSTDVNVEYGVVVKDVFGGGAGVASFQGGTEYKYIDFPNMARVFGKTEVNVKVLPTEDSEGNPVYSPSSTLVYGNVFGGGDVANVGDQEEEEAKTFPIGHGLIPRTKVTVQSGCVFNDVFAGGSGRVSEECGDYTQLGAVYGNTQLVIKQPEGDSGENATWLWKDVYGGGQNGTVYGNTLVEIEGGWLGYNVFGGGLGYIGSKYNPATGEDETVITDAKVTQNTNVRVTGGQYCLSQSWDDVERNWEPMTTGSDDKKYSSQYDHDAQKFLISHNIYGGGNKACTVDNDTYVDMLKGLLPENNRLGHQTYEHFFQDAAEWREIHQKHASPYFSIFGGGYGVNTHVAHDTNINVAMEGTTQPSNSTPDNGALYEAFYDRQSVLDVIGGGYEGDVTETCRIDIHGNNFIRNVFGGAYYATVGSTVINATRGNIENIYGGGMMGNVNKNVNVNFGQEHDNANDDDEAKTAKSDDNSQLLVMLNIYGGNDVSGYVGAREEADGSIHPTDDSEGVTMRLYGGTVYGSVYGGGNGDYLYHIDPNVSIVTADEKYPVGSTTTLVYNVPQRGAYFPSVGAMTSQQKMVNLASYRPGTRKVDIKFKGNSEDDQFVIKGDLFGGGNSATITNYSETAKADVKIDLGSHADLGGIYLGSDGEALFVQSDKNEFLKYFPLINDMTLYEEIDWEQPENKEIPTIFLPTPKDERPNVYQNNIDLYFMPVEMPVMPEVTWNGMNSSISDDTEGAMNADFTYRDPGITDLKIGTFCCGGNRGNMDTETKFHIYFPEGLTITENIIGGCNNANYTYYIPGQYDDDGNQKTLDHIGGFLLGTHGVGAEHAPQINLTLRNKFFIEKDAGGLYPEKCNVFGGCYKGGNVRGDIRLEVLSNMLMSGENGEGLDAQALRNSIDAKPSRSVCGVYGGGYGSETWVYGDTDVRLGNASIPCSYSVPSDSERKYNSTGTSCNLIFGGGREGSVVGNTAVRVLNGHVGSDVVGASYSGYLYGNAQVIVGYRDDYYVCQQTGKYHLNRVDDDPQHKFYVDANGKRVIKQDIWLTKGDLVSKASYDELDPSVQNTDHFTPSTYIQYPDNEGWSRINIQIDKAIYGGGYALAGGGSVGAGSYTVRKYTSKYNLNEYAEDIYGLPKGITLHDDNGNAAGGDAFGGNTFVMIGDRNEEDTRDHITISSSQLSPITPGDGQNLFGKYHEVTSNNGTPDNPDDDFTTIEYIRTDILWNSSMTEQFFEYIGEGGLYGDGHLSLAEGFRLSDMFGYGYNGSAPVGAKLMNCLHRFDIVRLEDCCFSLLGDKDYASTAGIAVDATPYSLANVGEIKMISSIDKTGKYMDPLKDKRSRNYMGLSNRVTNVGAVYSDVSFKDKFHHGNEGKYNKDTQGNDVAVEHEDYGEVNIAGMSYLDFKKKMIETYYDCTNGKVNDKPGSAIYFQLRNDGTAKNLIGIGSGYALVVDYEFDREKTQRILEEQNDVPTIPDNQGVDGTYYGPVKGVFEVNLISVREGEAGGYVYAQNIHEDASYGSEYGNKDHSDHFLETSGNFVFPVTTQRKVIDDCFPVKYNSVHHDAAADGHYWYVSGLKYFYNATITGYTFDNEEKTFDMLNSNLITLTGAKAGQQVTLEDFHIVNRHVDKAYACDFERKINDVPYGLLNQTDNTKASMADRYTFSISASKQNTYTESYERVNGDPATTVNVPHLATMQLNTLGEKQQTLLGVYGYDPDNNNKPLAYTLDQADAPISIRITDNVNNNGKLQGGESYYKTYLSDPCQAVIFLTVPAQDDNGFDVYNNDLFVQWDKTGEKSIDKVNIKRYYIVNFDGTYLGLKDDDLDNYDTSENRKLLYVLQDYRKLTKDEQNAPAADPSVPQYYISADDGKTFNEIPNDTSEGYWNANKGKLYVKPTPVKYEYTIDLSIRYIKGPSHSGNINIKNCALPGEMIRLSHENVIIESDENSLPHNGNFWIIGPGKKVWNDPDDHKQGWKWEFVDDYMGARTRTGVDLLGNSGTELFYNDPDTRNLYYPYNPFITDPKDNYRLGAYNTIITEGMHHPSSAESKEYYLPAYYYMNGYVAQYCYTVQGIKGVFRTDILPVDTLCVHNYHRMANVNDMATNTDTKNIPHDLFVPWAAQAYKDAPVIDAEHQDIQKEFASQWKATHHRPRVYIEDVNDLKAFAQYLARTADTHMPERTILPNGTEDVSGPVTYTEVVKPASDYGANTDFILMANIIVPNDWTPIAKFNGNLHGNGHVISGLANGKSLFATLGEQAHIYNLGMQSGKIASTEEPAKYSCCYTFANNTVYRKDGTAVTTYTADDWRYGRVAYDLNEFYLAERLDRGSNSGNDTHDHSGYVEELYEDGDYRYARFNEAPATSEYLRNSETPLYGWGADQTITEMVDANPDAHISRHAYTYNYDNETKLSYITHTVDESRAYYESEGDPAAAVLKEYRPLIDEAKHNSTEELTIKKNDYIFFGQTLNVSSVTNAPSTIGSTLPTVIRGSITTTSNNQPGNAVGVTHAVNDQANRIWRAYGYYQSKADDAFHFNKAAWALHPELTAIDFTGQHDSDNTWAAGLALANNIFYPKMMDMPDNMLSFDVMSNRNYNTNGTTRPYSNSNYGCVTQNLLVYNNDEQTAAGAAIFGSKDTKDITESAVLYHNLVFSGSPAEPTTDYLHLVDKQDFNAPIEFKVNTRAWYERTPSVFRNVSGTGESYATPSAWEGIILPFTAKKVSASENEEISHFYGETPASGVNAQTLHHEYWLTGMVDASDDKATFARPSTSGSALFTDETLARQESATYEYPVNTYFTGLENYTQYHGTRNDTEWYAEAHNFENYVYLSKTVPYLISFPGNDFYEFSLEGTNYNTSTHSKSGEPQLVTFEHEGPVTIAVSDDETGSHATTLGSHSHVGTYLHETDKLGVNGAGSAFTTEAGSVLPFRTYMTTSASAPRRILINEAMADELPHVDPDQPDDKVIDKLLIYVDGTNIVVESPVALNLPAYSVSGMRVSTLHIEPGVTIHPFQPGIYIVHRKKYIVR